jgi:hypothetical protein
MGGLRLLLSSEFGLTMRIAITLLVFLLTIEAFTSLSSLFTIGRQIRIEIMIGLLRPPDLLSPSWLSPELGLLKNGITQRKQLR